MYLNIYIHSISETDFLNCCAHWASIQTISWICWNSRFVSYLKNNVQFVIAISFENISPVGELIKKHIWNIHFWCIRSNASIWRSIQKQNKNWPNIFFFKFYLICLLRYSIWKYIDFTKTFWICLDSLASRLHNDWVCLEWLLFRWSTLLLKRN